jgi:esterase/lipase superfamily enzyme
LFKNVDFSGADLHGANLSSCMLENVKLTGTDLEEADLSNSFLSVSDFTEANLRRARLCRTRAAFGIFFTKADLREADLSQSDFSGLSGTRFKLADLTQADLRHANLRGCDLTEASLQDADFSHADLKDANLEGTDLRGARFFETDLQGASIYRVLPPDPDFSDALNVPSCEPRKIFSFAAAPGGGGGTGYYDPPEGESTAVKIQVHFATDRVVSDRAAPRHFYGVRDSDEMSLGTCEISIPKFKPVGEVPRPSLWRLEFRENLKKHVVLLNHRREGRDDFYKNVARARSKLGSKGQAFVFVHGYNVSFEDAVRRTAQLAYDFSFDGIPLCYSWASRASLKDYPADLASNERTWHRLAAFLSDISSLGHFSALHLICHSMGGRAICHSALQLLNSHKARKSPFAQVIFAAPDVEIPVFKDSLARISRLAKRITLYFSPNDAALSLSRRFHRAPRTGETAVVLTGLDTIDASEVVGDVLGHSVFGERTVLNDIYELLKKDRSPDQRFGLERIKLADGIYFKFKP